jgi:hypothetical protein
VPGGVAEGVEGVCSGGVVEVVGFGAVGHDQAGARAGLLDAFWGEVERGDQVVLGPQPPRKAPWSPWIRRASAAW